jgi:8-oxo-dGTP diphosphatase
MFGTSIVTIDLLPHCASTPREDWSSADELRPLSAIGLQQAAALARSLRPDAVYSSPALRCLQSVAPLAEAAGVPVVPMEGLREAHGFVEPAEWVSGPFAPIGPSIGGAWTAGRAAGVLFPLAARHAGQHVVLCSHGDTLPALLAYLAAAHHVPLPPLVPRGGWHRLHVRGGELSITSHTES